MRRLMFAAAAVLHLAGCEIPPYQTPLASDDAAGVAFWRCDQMAVAVVGAENDLFRQIHEREQLRRRCLAGEVIAAQDEPQAAPTDSESGPPPAGAIPPPPVLPRR